MTNIAIVGQDNNNMFGADLRYLQFFVGRIGAAVHVITPDTTLEFMKTMNAIVLPGGADVDAKRYHEKPNFMNSKPNVYLEFFDTYFLPELIGIVPLIGICRGIQSINVALGGTLIQHLYGHSYSNEQNELVHKVIVDGDKKYEVNSYHHQGIKHLAPGLEVLAIEDKKKDPVIEAVKSDKLKVFAVQWHPERLEVDPFSEKYIFELLERSK